jgi:hypothetical protein
LTLDELLAIIEAMVMDEAIKQEKCLIATQLAFGGSAEEFKAFAEAYKEATK